MPIKTNSIPRELIDKLRYDPETGKLFWIIKPCRSIRVGSEAGYFKRGYVRVHYCGISYAAHRLACACVHGDLSPDVEVDHEDLNRSNNKWSNLRIALRSPNTANQAKRPHGTSKYKGVYWNKRRNKWQAQITVNCKNKNLGQFDDEYLAHCAYVKAATAAHGKFARAA